MTTLKTTLLTSVIIMAFVVSCKTQPVSDISTNQWKEDIDYLVSKMASIIPNYQKRVDSSLLEVRLAILKQSIESKSSNQIVVALEELLNTVKDESCYIYPFQEQLNYKILPIRTYWFEDGMYILDATLDYKHLLGRQITTINNHPLDSVFSILQSNLNGDNIGYQKYIFSRYSLIPKWLDGNSLGGNKDQIILGFENGDIETVTAEIVEEYFKTTRSLAGYKQLVKTSNKHEGVNYWMEFLAEEKILVIQFLQIRNSQDGKSLKSFFKEVEKRISNPDIDKVVIDNRYGGGGNGFKLKPFTDMIKNNKKINQNGKLFVLTSRTTRGTVMELTSILDLNTKATIIGEPTGEGPNLVGDRTKITLPNSQIEVELTNKFFPTSWDEDLRTSLEPHINIAYSFSDYKSKIDPWMDAVVAYKSSNSNLIFPENLKKSLEGSYTINGRKVKISNVGGALMLTMKRKRNSFFELNTMLYMDKPGILSTDITDVFVNYSTNSENQISVVNIDWKGLKLVIE